MRNKNSATIIGSVKLKSKSAAFSNSSAKEGGACERENEAAARMTETDLREEGVKERSWWGFGIMGRAILGRALILGLKEGIVGVDVIGALDMEEAMIMFAISMFLLSSLVFPQRG
ncbi:unnamed protein product [Fraxinus pennsylvanica]|uniref:Uncharacterized protein n=1 Tax=Fraxinus pennsylvanica TaxID=56036 RepID=A0AAD2EBY5_9LAMI|nr:unnamed protein product [Fraxinus pennsylvanica]